MRRRRKVGLCETTEEGWNHLPALMDTHGKRMGQMADGRWKMEKGGLTRRRQGRKERVAAGLRDLTTLIWFDLV